MKGDIELVYFYKDWKSISDVIQSLKLISDDSFIKKIYDSSFNESIRKNIPYGEQNILYNWGEDALIISFEW